MDWWVQISQEMADRENLDAYKSLRKCPILEKKDCKEEEKSDKKDE